MRGFDLHDPKQAPRSNRRSPQGILGKRNRREAACPRHTPYRDIANDSTYNRSVKSKSAARPTPKPDINFGLLLRRWRAVRHISQLHLALDADISTRHLSCVETGRAQPSREMVLRLSEALQVPLRERNALLLAAGYAPLYRQTSLDAPEMDAARRAVDLLLRQQEPFPGIVIDRYWNTLSMNAGTKRFLEFSPAAILCSRET